jgi:UDP-glucose 4-epimerase
MNRILVTGGLGFIGSHIADYFLHGGDEVTLIDNTSSNVVSPEFYKNKADVFIGDIADESVLEKISSRKIYDYVFHFAANASVPKSVENEDLNFRSNVLGTYNVLRKAAEHGSSVILASTSAIYGEYYGKAVDEKTPKKPISPYGITKLIDEDLLFYYSRIRRNKAIAFRFFNVYGPRQKRYVMSDFIKKITETRTEESIEMLGSGNEIRDFINIKDALKAIVLPLKCDDMWGDAYNVGSGSGMKIRHVLSTILEELGLNYTITFSGKSWEGDIFGISADNRKIRSFGFEPIVDFRTGLREFIKAEREKGQLATFNPRID